MGAWGYFDDENDYAHDLWQNVTDKILPKSIIGVLKDRDVKFELSEPLMIDYLKTHSERVFTEIKKYVESRKEASYDKVGLILRAINFYSTQKRRPNSLPKMPKSFPKALLKIAQKENNITIKNLEAEKKKGWGKFEDRIKALNKQQKFFNQKVTKKK
jgi:hypothetical protein